MSTLETPVSAFASRRRFTVDEWHQMIEAGIFHDDDRIELLDGEIDEMTPIGRQHIAVAITPGAFPDLAVAVDEILG